MRLQASPSVVDDTFGGLRLSSAVPDVFLHHGLRMGKYGHPQQEFGQIVVG